MGRDGLTTLWPKKIRPDPISRPAWACIGAKIREKMQIDIKKTL